MIELNLENVTSAAIGTAHGLDLTTVFERYRSQASDIVSRLYNTKDEPGGWKKWLNLGEDKALADSLKKTAASLKGRFSDMVVLGIGGSSLGGKALLSALLPPYWNLLPDAGRNGYPRFHFVENVDSDDFAGLLDLLNPAQALIVVITKSGGTPETMSTFMIAKAWLEAGLGSGAPLSDHVIAVTDAKKGILREIADELNLVSFEVPDDVGGRFSVFSAVGLLLAALCGLNPAEFQAGLREIDPLLRNPDLLKNPAAQAAIVHHAMYEAGQHEAVFMPYSQRLALISDWFVQLWAESLGKRHNINGEDVFTGPTPVRAVGVTDQHSQLQLFNEGPFNKLITFVEVAQPDRDITIPADQFADVAALAYLHGQPLSRLMSAELAGTRTSLRENHRANLTISLPKVDAAHLAQLLYLLEVQTAIMGELLGVDPFDQPGVEAGKLITKKLMSEPRPQAKTPSAAAGAKQ